MKKLKFTIIALMLCVILFGCNGSFDSDKCLQSVKEVFPRSKIYSNCGSITRFIVVDSTGVKEVKTGHVTNAKISEITVLMER